MGLRRRPACDAYRETGRPSPGQHAAPLGSRERAGGPWGRVRRSGAALRSTAPSSGLPERDGR
eukprot:11158114-Lingulodinium_polyedra.AAC.1